MLGESWATESEAVEAGPMLLKPLFSLTWDQSFRTQKGEKAGGEGAPPSEAWSSVGKDLFVERINKEFCVRDP